MTANGRNVGVIGIGVRQPNQAGGEQAKCAKDYLAGLIRFGRVGQSDEIAKSVLFLACDQASIVNGVELLVDGSQVQI